MARQVIKNASFVINGVDLSDHVEQIAVDWTATDVDVTAMGDTGKQHLAGLQDNKISVTFWQDHAVSKVSATLDAMIAAGTAVAFKLGDNGNSFSATNPSYSGSAILLTYQPVAGQVGSGQQAPVTFAVNGAITAGTA